MGAPQPETPAGMGLSGLLGRALLCLGAMLFLGFGLGLSAYHGFSSAWTLGLMVALMFILVLMARWQVRFLSKPIGQLPGGGSPPSMKELPGAWSALKQENSDLRDRLALDERLLPGLMARLEEGVLLFGVLGELEQFNPAAQRHLGLGAPLAKGMGVRQILTDPESLAAVERALGGLGSEWRLVRAARSLRARAIPFAPLGTQSGVLITLDDVTSQEALEQTRQKFISNVSHELKTPVTAIRMAAEYLQGEPLSEPAAASAASMLRSVDRLTLLLEDLSELSRIESGSLHLNPQSLLLEEVFQQVLTDLRQHPATRGLDLRGRCLARPDTRVVVDPLRLHQIVENLVSNAAKFSPAGSPVEVDVLVAEHSHVWRVRDEGPGIPEAELGRIFERFYRASTGLGKPGTGLGLAIVKHLCRLMGGEVTVQSASGFGTTFTVRLPLVPQASEALPSL